MPGEEPDMFDVDWLGLMTDNRRLFDGLQDGWLRPLPPQTGLLVGVNAHLREPGAEDGNRIPVRIQMDVSKLPDLKVMALRCDDWESMPLSQVAGTDSAVLWPGVLPLFSIRRLTVSSEEQRVRLLSIGRRISNITVPQVSVDCEDEAAAQPLVSPPTVDAQLVVPKTEDSMRGAISMALWAVPRIDPWMDVLTASLCSSSQRLQELADAVDASWWRFPPWRQSHDDKPIGSQEHLWLAAVAVLGSPDCVRPREAVDRIADKAREVCSAADAQVVRAWRLATHQVLRAETTIRHEDWRCHPVGLAIQLVLSRPDPTTFKTWFEDDHVDLPPAVAWSAAALCGLFHGHRGLDVRFRGKQNQHEVVAVQTLRMCSGGTDVNWPDMSNDPPQWCKETGNYILSWGGREFACKHEQERGRWYAADLGINALLREAVAIAKDRNWPCVSQVLTLKEGSRSISCPSAVEFDERTMRVHGNVRIRLSPEDLIEEAIDGDVFRRLVAVEPGRLPAPTLSLEGMRLDQEDFGIPGLSIVREFLTEEEEQEVLAEIDNGDWSNELQRRVQHYGWRYDYKLKQVDPSMRVGPLPAWADRIAQRLFDTGCVRELPDQVIVNEYIKDQGIAPHIDSRSSFADGVAMISLLETWEMQFQKQGSNHKVVVKLDRRSATLLDGEARHEWKHAIPKRKNEPGAIRPGNKRPSRVPRRRRVSLTFRKVKVTANDLPPQEPRE